MFVEPPLPTDVVRDVEDLMSKLEEKLIVLSHKLFAAEFNEAEELLRRLGPAVQSFSSRIRTELRRARKKLNCCHLEYKQQPMQRGGWGVYFLTAGIILFLMLVYVSIPVADEEGGPLLRR